MIIDHVFENSDELVRNFSDYLRESVEQVCYETNNSKPCFHLALSGGSTPDILFNYLSANHEKEQWLSKVAFYWVDERYVAHDNEQSNFGRANKLLLQPCKIETKNIHPIHYRESAMTSAQEYEKELLSALPQIEGVPQFDLIILGLGGDGHTASIFPKEIDLWNSQKICEVGHHDETRQERITITGKVINRAKEVVFIICGAEKMELWEKLRKNDASTALLPASKVNPLSGKMAWWCSVK